MAANTTPIYRDAGQIGWPATALTAANTARDGASGTTYTLFTASADGGTVVKVRLLSRGTNPASVFRLFVNNGASSGTAANNSLLAEVSLPQTTASESLAQTPLEIGLGFDMPATYVLFGTLGTAVTDGWQATVIGTTF